MKPVITILFVFLFFTACKKHTITPVNQLSLLPPATQTGARTFGCLVNGQAYIPQNQNLLEGPDLQCNYIYTEGGYHLTVAGGNKNSAGVLSDVIVGTDSLAVAEGGVYDFSTFHPVMQQHLTMFTLR